MKFTYSFFDDLDFGQSYLGYSLAWVSGIFRVIVSWQEWNLFIHFRKPNLHLKPFYIDYWMIRYQDSFKSRASSRDCILVKRPWEYKKAESFENEVFIWSSQPCLQINYKTTYVSFKNISILNGFFFDRS